MLGRELLATSLAARPSVVSPDYWAEQAGEWVLADDELKVRLFRLVDCMPMLDDPAAVDRHLREYLDDEVLEKLPAMLRVSPSDGTNCPSRSCRMNRPTRVPASSVVRMNNASNMIAK